MAMTNPAEAKLSVLTPENGEASKPVATMLDKVSHAVGVLPFPGLGVKMAPPPMNAPMEPEKSDGKANDLQRRAWMRFIQEQAIQQINMEAIVARAVPLVKETADAEAMDEDWIAQFFTKCRTISNEAMRDLWAKVLAAEVNQPGAFSKRTLNLLAELDRRDIEAFALLCSFAVYSLGSPAVFFKSSLLGASYNPSFYVKHGLDLALLNDMKSLGLIEFDAKAEYTRPPGPVRYFGHTLALKPQEQIKVGNAAFTKTGWELAKVIVPREIPGFFEHLQRVWKGSIVDASADGKGK
jgi:hypothetical protein